MALFTYVAINDKGNTVNGTVEASDRSTALATLRKEKLRPVSIKDKRNTVLADLNNLFRPHVKGDSLVLFTRQLSTMIGAGVPILRAIKALQDTTDDKALQDILATVIKDVQGGSNLADALAKHPLAFNDVYVNMIRAGEAGGILDQILARTAFQLEKNAVLKRKIRGAMTYPLVLLVITVISFFGLMLFVVPRLGDIVRDLGGEGAELPLITQIMLGISDFFVHYWWFLLIVVAVGGFLLARYFRTASGKRILHTTALRIPVIRTIVVKVANARFARTFASLLGAGVSVIEALKVTSRGMGNVVYEEEIARAIEEVRNGRQVSEALHNTTLFPPIITQMLSVGEETGQTETTLTKVADFYDEQVNATVNGLSSIIEPVMIIIMGAMVGLIAASVMLPISGLAQQIQG